MWNHCLAVEAAAPPCIQRAPAAFLLDQEKAFEMLTYAWVRQCMDHHGWPLWVKLFVIAQMEGRRVVGSPLPLPPGRCVRRGVGMGGPGSMCSWAVGCC